MSGGISIHVVDVVSGRPAIGMRVVLRRLDPNPVMLADGTITADGTLSGPHATGVNTGPGFYEALFDIGGFYGKTDGFLTRVPFHFHVRDDQEHVHLPLKFSPWGLAMFRGL